MLRLFSQFVRSSLPSVFHTSVIPPLDRIRSRDPTRSGPASPKLLRIPRCADRFRGFHGSSKSNVLQALLKDLRCPAGAVWYRWYRWIWECSCEQGETSAVWRQLSRVKK